MDYVKIIGMLLIPPVFALIICFVKRRSEFTFGRALSVYVISGMLGYAVAYGISALRGVRDVDFILATESYRIKYFFMEVFVAVVIGVLFRRFGRKLYWWKVSLAFLICVFSIWSNEHLKNGIEDWITSITGARVVHQTGEWNMIVVNKWNPLPSDYAVSLASLENGKKVDERILTDLNEMIDAGKTEGVILEVVEAYRSGKEQQTIFSEKRVAYQEDGYTAIQAERLTKKLVAMPGFSEHETGLAIDINAGEDGMENTTVYDWLEKNAAKYGFIQRYPAGMEQVTGIDYEPWHYRYVGKENAYVIMKEKEPLEEMINEK